MPSLPFKVTMLSMGGRRQARRSIRLKDYDYGLAGGYFVTICVKDGVCLLGEIAEDEVTLNSLGLIVDEEWRRTDALRQDVLLDVYQVMPNHFHGILWLLNELKTVPNQVESAVRARRASPLQENDMKRRYLKGPESGSLGAVIGAFKSASTQHRPDE